MGGVKCWYIRRYKRILVPYFIIADIGNILAVMGGRTIAEAVLNISTISYWLEHKGAWYIAMLVPLYAITPLVLCWLLWLKRKSAFRFCG